MTQLENYGQEMDVHGERENPISLMNIVRLLRDYAAPIVLAVLAVAIAYLLFAVVYLLIQPVERYTTIGFRLEFPGAENGQYPNGVRFSGSDIIDTPLLRTVYDENQLGRYMSFSTFSRAVVVLEANAALHALAREYEAKLVDPKLSPIDRDRIEAEYTQKRESLRKSDYALTWAVRDGVKRIPQSVASKTLSDILRTWADFAARTRQVLVHRVPLVSDQAIGRVGASDPDILASLLALRTAARELQENSEELAALPGAEVIRSTKRGASLRELRLELAHIEGAGIEYLINETLGGVTDRAHASALIRAQLEYDRRALMAAEERVTVLRHALEDYTRPMERPSTPTTTAETPERPDDSQAPGQTLVLSDNFLDRVMALSQNAADREYRQRKVDEIRAAAIDSVPLRSRVAYAEQLLARVAAGGSGSLDSRQVTARRDQLAASLATVAADLIDIRGTLSRSLTASGQIYTITAPAVAVTERSVDVRKLALGGIFIVFFTAVLAVALSFVHSRLAVERGQGAAA